MLPIPEPYRLLALAGAALVVFGAGFGTGAKVQSWKDEAGFSEHRQRWNTERAGLQKEIADLTLATELQNAAVASLHAESQAAAEAKRKAEEFAGQLAAFSKSRMDRLQSALSETCGDVTRQYWEMRK